MGRVSRSDVIRCMLDWFVQGVESGVERGMECGVERGVDRLFVLRFAPVLSCLFVHTSPAGSSMHRHTYYAHSRLGGRWGRTNALVDNVSVTSWFMSGR